MRVSRFTGRAHGHEDKVIELIVLLSWRWGLPITLYPSAPPQYRSGISQLPTSQPLKQGYIVTEGKLIILVIAISWKEGPAHRLIIVLRPLGTDQG
jgi:hypothetical protein